MEFEEQITDAELVINTTPRVYVKWNNTEEGRDKKDCYERIVIGESVIYVNAYNKNSSVIYGHPFWDKLEKIYNDCIIKEKLNISDINNNLDDIYLFKVSDYTTTLLGRFKDGKYYIQRGDGTKYEYEEYRIVWKSKLNLTT